MTDTLPWTNKGKTFADGSQLSGWVKIYQSLDWHWQYDTHQFCFAIYEHDGQYWKLYHARFVREGDDKYTYGFGGQACRMVLVEYLFQSRSPHSSMLKKNGDKEWIRTYEYDPMIHKVLKVGERNVEYGEPYEIKHAV